MHSYISPHLVRFHERIRLAGKLISDQALADLLEEVEAVNGSEPVTFFEITTAAAMLAFSRTKADLTLLETGLGGRLDSTNVLDDILTAVITPIAHDHEHFLGDTLTAITREKAGIMRKGRPVLTAGQPPEAMEVLKAEAERAGSELLIAGRDFTITPAGEGVTVEMAGRRIEAPKISLTGDHQKDNAGLAAAALMLACPQIEDDALISGMAGARWPGRIQHLAEGSLVDMLPRNISLWVDGAHNAHGAGALARSLEQISKAPWVLVCGAMSTRPVADFLKPLSGLAGEVICMTIPEQPAALNANEVAEAARDLGFAAQTATGLDSAVEKAAMLAERNGGNIIIAGSLYLAGHVLAENNTLPD